MDCATIFAPNQTRHNWIKYIYFRLRPRKRQNTLYLEYFKIKLKKDGRISQKKVKIQTEKTVTTFHMIIKFSCACSFSHIILFR